MSYLPVIIIKKKIKNQTIISIELRNTQEEHTESFEGKVQSLVGTVSQIQGKSGVIMGLGLQYLFLSVFDLQLYFLPRRPFIIKTRADCYMPNNKEVSSQSLWLQFFCFTKKAEPLEGFHIRLSGFLNLSWV